MTFIRPGDHVFKDQLNFLDHYSDLREDRASEIITQLGPQYAFWGSVVYLHPDNTRKTIELIDAALRLANFVEMRIKHALACGRRTELSPQVHPLILTPGHGSFPSGHRPKIIWPPACSGNFLRCLWGNHQGHGRAADAGGARIAVNRTVAVVHYPSNRRRDRCLALRSPATSLRAPQVSPPHNSTHGVSTADAIPAVGFRLSQILQAGTGAESAPAYIDQLNSHRLQNRKSWDGSGMKQRMNGRPLPDPH